ncbi:MAG: hypothetical protein WCO06_01505 [Candidatus Roizmanbacteria bacterium]
MHNDSAPSLILVKTALDKLLDEATIELAVTGKATAKDEAVFTQDSATNAAVVTSVIGAGGYFQSTTDDVALSNEAQVTAAAQKTSLVVQFKKNLPISRTFMADQQLSAVSKAVRQQALTWGASQDRNAFSVYSLGFTTQLTIDGIALFSNSHVNQNGDTVDNLETGALTDPNLNIMVNSLRTQLSQTGVILGYEPKFLLTPSILHQTGMVTAKSVLRAGGANNDLNYFSEMYPGMKVVYSPFLDATSTTAFFLGGQTHGVYRFEREAFFTDLVDWKVSINDQYMYKMRAREVVDSIEYSGLVGSSGTTA